MPKPFARLVNDKQLVKKLESLEKKAAKKIRKKMVRAGATPIKKAIKRLMPVDKGAAKASIDIKFTKGGGGAVIGADAEFEQDGERPANYIHLIENGHVMANGQTVPGAHPIERGSKAAEAESARKMTAKAESELNKLFKK